NVCWFYTDKDGIHTRSIPDLKIITPFSTIQKNMPEQSELISISRFSDAQNNNYVTLDEKNNAIYFAAQNGLYYSVNTNTLQVNEIQIPSSALLEGCLKENSTVSFYKTHLQNMYHHDLVMQDGAIMKIEKENSIGKIMRTEKKSENEKDNVAQLTSNQFIEGSILMNGISITGNTILYDPYRTPLALINKENALYLLHKDKIAPDAHVIISRYNTDEQTISWRYDVSANFSEEPELERIYTQDNKIIFIFKTSPDLDDIFTCVAIDSNSGKEIWKFIF
ncbi:MAG: hypothetical protein H7Y00_04935, partial [Fimbriimonadaceae bacterium]|nr:hypothetical protein [Chitinophagales bacterium]